MSANFAYGNIQFTELKVISIRCMVAEENIISTVTKYTAPELIQARLVVLLSIHSSITFSENMRDNTLCNLCLRKIKTDF